jgi:hypothetical protein
MAPMFDAREFRRSLAAFATGVATSGSHPTSRTNSTVWALFLVTGVFL